MNLIELTHKNDILQTYEIYKHCMFMPTEEKFNKKVEQFLNNNSVKIFACFSHGKIVGVMAVSFIEQKKVEILGIAVDLSARGKGIGSYMIKQVINNYDLLSVYAETDNDAVGFYQKNNFSITEFSEIYDGETVIRYKRDAFHLTVLCIQLLKYGIDNTLLMHHPTNNNTLVCRAFQKIVE